MSEQFNIHRYQTLLWDFDGVILNSMPIRDRGFVRVLEDFPEDQVEALLDYHRKNGGLSRYVKFRYFFEEIRGEELTDARLAELAAAFSRIMLEELGNPDLLIQPTHRFLDRKHKDFSMHVVSGSDQHELRKLCEILQLSHFFKSIHGSPTPKKEWVGRLMEQHSYEPQTTALIGDSINDYEAAAAHGVDFLGFNNPALEEVSVYYIRDFDGL